jgi:hypothetical protein
MSVTRRPKLRCNPANRCRQLRHVQQLPVAHETKCTAVEVEMVCTEYRVKLQGRGGDGGLVLPGLPQQATMAAGHSEPPPENSKTRRRFVL